MFGRDRAHHVFKRVQSGQRGGAAHAALFEQKWQMLSCFGVCGIGREEADFRASLLPVPPVLFFLRIALNSAATASIATDRAASRRSSSVDAFFSAATSALACPGVGMKIPSDGMSSMCWTC